MPDLVITITVPQAKRQEAVAAFLKHYPNITTDPTQWEGDPLPDPQWVKRRTRMWFNEMVHLGRNRIAEQDYTPPDFEEFGEGE